jgi:hypothetical protein
MLIRVSRLLLLWSLATFLIVGSTAHLAAAGVYSCQCGNNYSEVYDYSNNYYNGVFYTSIYTGPWTSFSMASCGSYCQNWMLDIGGQLCDGQGFTSRGQGFVLLDWYYIWGDANAVAHQGFPNADPEQYDCADTHL